MKDTLYKKLESLNQRYHELHQALEDHTLVQDLKKFKLLSKELSKIKSIHEGFKEYQALENLIQENENLLQDEDPALKDLAIEEKESLESRMKSLHEQIKTMLIPEDPNDHRNVFLEIRAAVGGAEAAIFVGDLLKMYLRYAEKNKWTAEIIQSQSSEQGGYKEVVLRLIGKSVYSQLKFESGAHRIQRVPTTETQGRLHTSTCTVAVLPEVEPVDAIDIAPQELRIDTFRASGAGGQHVQKTDSAIRIVHLPTNLTIECQDERSQHKNKERAMSLLKAKLLSLAQKQQHQERASTRRSLIGTGDRSERIRTYNIPQSRFTDHRIQLTLYQLDAVLAGDLDLIIEPLKHHDQIEQLADTL